MKSRIWSAVGLRLGTLVLSAAVSTAAGATTFMFNFNTVSNGASSAAIQTYMTSVFGSTVGVTGAIASNSYRGDGHVVGPSLGTSDGATSPSDSSHDHPRGTVDTFIMNNGPTSNSFTLNFGAAYLLTSLSFDWEIFPDASCSSLTCPSVNFPDIELLVDGNPTPIWSMLGIGAVNPQNIGVASLSLSGAHSITFMDWPAEVGIDNLVITGRCAPTAPGCAQGDVPEPPSLPLVLLALAGFLVARRFGSRKPKTERAVH